MSPCMQAPIEPRSAAGRSAGRSARCAGLAANGPRATGSTKRVLRVRRKRPVATRKPGHEPHRGCSSEGRAPLADRGQLRLHTAARARAPRCAGREPASSTAVTTRPRERSGPRSLARLFLRSSASWHAQNATSKFRTTSGSMTPMRRACAFLRGHLRAISARRSWHRAHPAEAATLSSATTAARCPGTGSCSHRRCAEHASARSALARRRPRFTRRLGTLVNRSRGARMPGTPRPALREDMSRSSRRNQGIANRLRATSSSAPSRATCGSRFERAPVIPRGDRRGGRHLSAHV